MSTEIQKQTGFSFIGYQVKIILESKKMNWYRIIHPDKRSEGLTDIILSGQRVTITGYFGDAIYRFETTPNIQNMRHTVVEYLEEKCTCSPKGKRFLAWNEKLAFENFVSSLLGEELSHNDIWQKEAQLDDILRDGIPEANLDGNEKFEVLHEQLALFWAQQQ